MYMHNQDDKYPARRGFEPGISRLQAPVDTNEPLYAIINVDTHYYIGAYKAWYEQWAVSTEEHDFSHSHTHWLCFHYETYVGISQ